VGIASHLIHLCDIQRSTETQDEYNETERTYASHLSNVRFRLVEKTERETPSEFGEGALITVYLGLMAPGTDVDEDDRLVNIRFEDGTIDNHTYTVEHKLTRRARTVRHISLQLERVR
jgi:hypothetical protein